MSKIKPFNFKRALLPLVFGALALSGCRQDMHDNPRFEAYEDGANRQVPAGTVARGALTANVTYPSTMKVADQPVGSLAAPAASTGVVPVPKGDDGFPFKVTAEVLDRGQERYNITCLPCHGQLGDGKGMIGLRGFKKPPSYHEERLRQAPASYLYDVITHGFGAMSNYAQELTPEDRWKIAAYIRVLQLSQRVDFNSLPDADKARLNAIEFKRPAAATPAPVATTQTAAAPAAAASAAQAAPATPLKVAPKAPVTKAAPAAKAATAQ